MKKRPNILFITTDQQRQDTLGCYGNERIHTPVLDSLAKEGMRWDRAYVANPVCSPSRASLLTGRYPHTNGLTVNGKALPSHEVTIGQILHSIGYDTAVVGKVHLGPTVSNDVEQIESKWMGEDGDVFFRDWHGPYYGFEEVHLSIGHATGGNHGHYGLWLEENFPDAVKHFCEPAEHALKPPSGAPFGSLHWGLPAEAHSSVWTAELACDYLDRHCADADTEADPFFLWVSFQDPHAPLACPAPYCNLHDPEKMKLPIPAPVNWDDYPPHYAAKHIGSTKNLSTHAGEFHFPGGGEGVDSSSITEDQMREMIANYYGMVSLVDEQIGCILDNLKKNGLKDDTIVVFTSDHGELLGDHGLWMKGAYHYEGLIKVPLLWCYPNQIPAGKSTSALYSHVDLATTLLDLAGVERNSGMQGISQKAVLLGDTSEIRTEALCEFRIHNDLPALNAKTLIGSKYKLTCYAGYDFGEMFDLVSDPEERKNLWNEPQFKDIKQDLRLRLMNFLMHTEDPLPVQVSDH